MRCEICGAPMVDTIHSLCSRCSQTEAAKKVVQQQPAEMHRQTVAGGYSKLSNKAPLTSAPPPKKEVPERNSRATAPLEDTAPAVSSRSSLPPIIQGKAQVVKPSSVVLENKYRLIDELGRGSMGTVFLAEDQMLRRNVAVKFLLPELGHSSECAIRFKREAMAMARISNENVAQIYSYGEDKGNPYFVMEYLEGETVEHKIDAFNRRGIHMPLHDVMDIMVQILNGVAAIHRQGSVHRDIKPGNVIVCDETNKVVIMDFGLVRDVEVEDDIRTLAGTPAYIAPELVEGKDGAAQSKLSDIYSIGATFYELLTGSIPFNGPSWVDILRQHIVAIPDFPSTCRPGIPDIVDEVVMRALAKSPTERFESGEEFLDAIFDIVDVLEAGNFEQSGEFRTLGNGAIARHSGNTGAFRRSSGRRRSSSSIERSSGGFRRTPSYSRSRLLVVDGDRAFRSQIYELTKKEMPGCKIFSATDGAMALDIIKNNKPTALIINLHLSEVSGFEIIASSLGDPAYDDITIIAVCDNAGSRDIALLKKMGIRHVYTKPVDVDSLLEVLIPALEKSLVVRSAAPSAPY